MHSLRLTGIHIPVLGAWSGAECLSNTGLHDDLLILLSDVEMVT